VKRRSRDVGPRIGWNFGLSQTGLVCKQTRL
jgi:hypothetical protein